MSEAEFQRYWRYDHAVNYASRIPQIVRYSVNLRLPLAGDTDSPPFGGVAEIWLRNEQEQLASLQSREFLEGARADEPRWAAFWATLALDTTGHLLQDEDAAVRDRPWIKWYVLMKRRPGLSVEAFRAFALRAHAPRVRQLPGLRRYVQCHVRDSAYALGEPRFDGVSLLWFDTPVALVEALGSSAFRETVQRDWELFVEPRYLVTLAAEEHWVIRPGEREPPNAIRGAKVEDFI
jgi:uncharacterized protein (TIGR02118 family)